MVTTLKCLLTDGGEILGKLDSASNSLSSVVWIGGTALGFRFLICRNEGAGLKAGAISVVP